MWLSFARSCSVIESSSFRQVLSYEALLYTFMLASPRKWLCHACVFTTISMFIHLPLQNEPQEKMRYSTMSVSFWSQTKKNKKTKIIIIIKERKNRL